MSSEWILVNLGMLLFARNLSFVFKQSFMTMHYGGTRLGKLVYAQSLYYNVLIIKLRRGISEEDLGGCERAFIPPLDILVSRHSAI